MSGYAMCCCAIYVYIIRIMFCLYYMIWYDVYKHSVYVCIIITYLCICIIKLYLYKYIIMYLYVIYMILHVVIIYFMF